MEKTIWTCLVNYTLVLDPDELFLFHAKMSSLLKSAYCRKESSSRRILAYYSCIPLSADPNLRPFNGFTLVKYPIN